MQCFLLLYIHKETLHLLMSNRQYKYHYFYKIINKNTQQYYFGIHSTNDLNDNYMGSGSFLKREYKKWGKDNFVKEILKFFDDRKTLAEYEAKVVNENILSDPLCLNVAKGGITGFEDGFTVGLITVRDSDGNCFDVKKTDSRYLSGELQSINKHSVPVRDKFGKTFRVPVDDPRYISGELVIVSKGNKGGTGRTYVMKGEECKFILKEELQQYLDDGWVQKSRCKGRVSPTKGNIWIHRDGIMKCINKMELNNYIDNGWQRGRLVNTLKNRIGIMKGGVSKYINSEDLDKYLNEGWQKGMQSRNKGKITVYDETGKVFHINKDDPRWINKEVTLVQFKNGPSCKDLKYINKSGNIKRVKPELLQQYINDGWKIGMK